MTAPVVVVTGTSSGIGRLTVRRFAEAGWNVVATVRDKGRLDVHDEVDNVHTLVLDVDDEQVDLGFGETARAVFGRVDALINNAGYFQSGPLEATTMEQAHRQFQTNVFGLMALNKAFIPIFRAQRSGVIVNFGSISAEQGYPYTSVYEASKAAVVSLSEGLHQELAEFGVSVKAILPGNMKTPIFDKVDRSSDVPADYAESMSRFGQSNLVRSDPALTAEVVFRMVTDGNVRKVRYYSGPDGEAVPRVKQLLGQDWYWDEFSAATRGNASPLWLSVVPRPIAATD
ncbi:MAG TPA: SDR family oxidoreductase [Pseudonocardiaceae bacterium]|jgi:NAD(P)-dependent dehydrogenase (short-subunit alcohol dehydrogenase family)|nr:SDR family oxidoreductase [Pseudonocardiaceae bacterium]